MSKVSMLLVLAMMAGCGPRQTLSPNDDGGGGNLDTASGTGGAGPGGSGGGGTTGTGGSTGGSGGSGAGGFGGALGGLLDGGLGGLLDSGIIGGCPTNPAGQACGGQGMPLACVRSVDAGPAGCLCVQQQWFCGGGGAGGAAGAGGADAGFGINQPPCPDNANGTACTMVASICRRASDGGTGLCGCLPGQGGTATWRCTN